MAEARRLRRLADAHWWAGVAAAALPLLLLLGLVWAGRLMPGTAVGAFARWCRHGLFGRPMPWMWASIALLVVPPALRATASTWRRLAATRRFCGHLAGLTGELPRPLAERAGRLGLAGRVRLWPAPVVDVRTVGLRRPVILMTTQALELLSDDEFEAVLRHECAHLRRADPIKVLVAGALRDGFGWLPAVTVLLQGFEEAKEFAADAWAAAGSSPRTLARALVKVLLDGSYVLPPTVAAAPFTGTAEARLAYLIEGRPPALALPGWRALVGSAGLSLLLWGVLLGSCVLSLR